MPAPKPATIPVEKTSPSASTEPEWQGWAVCPSPQGWRWRRVLLPAEVVARYAVDEPPEAPNTRAVMTARIGADLASDRLVDRRGWRR